MSEPGLGIANEAAPLPAGDTGVPLTRRETREIITPYAFEVCPSLLGVPTAPPLRRLLAIGIDGLLVTGLAKAALVCIVPVILYLAYFRWQARRYWQLLLVLVFGLIWSMTASVVPELVTERAPSADKMSDTQALVVAGIALKLQQDNCDNTCMTSVLTEAAGQLKQTGMNKKQARSILNDLVETTDYPAKQWQDLRKQLLSEFPAQAKTQASAVVQGNAVADTAAAKTAVVANQAATEESRSPDATAGDTTANTPWYQPDDNTHSVLDWAKGILSDIGIGFGWAAAYFTLTIAWCHGQSLGKRLLQIKVIQLDGKELNLMAAFARQGGYGAGFATGLLGFLQVLWDPNRQAIQDKVASTVVIWLHQPKRPLTH